MTITALPQKAPVQKPSIVGKKELPISELSCKLLLTLDEAARYTGLGLQKLREISNTQNCQIIMWNGSKRMFKRKKGCSPKEFRESYRKTKI